ncbi:MAG TPA: pilus assembly protein TadG-related protein [Pirellulales bacterium]|nr:pilus assembly protein TadG-related protein [Pirellulales bacterium]
MPRRRRSKSRKGAVIVLVALFLVVVLAMAAFSTDVGYICLTQTQLQTAADAAALAGAQKCLLPSVPGSAQFDAVCAQTVRQAQSAAAAYARQNQAGGVDISLASADITVGNQASFPGAPVTAWQAGLSPNAVQVVTRRDAIANGPLALFFAPLLGVEHSSLKATATAAYETGRYSVTGFSPASGQNAKLLPIAIDVGTWTQFRSTGCSANGASYDDYTAGLVLPDSSVEPPANVSAGGDGIPELVGAYPQKTAPGNFGLVDLSASGGCNGDIANWILNGASAGDLSSFGPQGLQATSGAPAALRGNTGLTSCDVRDFAAIVGQPRIVPLYSSYSGNGANAGYSIVGFAGVTVVHAAGAGSNISIILQPALVVDSTAATSSSAATLGDFVYPRVPLALTR